MDFLLFTNKVRRSQQIQTRKVKATLSMLSV